MQAIALKRTMPPPGSRKAHDVALRTISICAGVGGLDLGVRIARPDARCVAFVEREASAAASLVASMEAGRLHPAPVWSDLRTFDAGAWRGAVDCVLSGDPCQGNSVAGKRLGEADDRWLLDRAIDVYDRSGAHTFFRENVVGNLVGQLAVAIPALERLGCRVAVGIFSAAEVGAKHRRERLFILAHRDGWIAEQSPRLWRLTGAASGSRSRGQPDGRGGTLADAECGNGGSRTDESNIQDRARSDGHAGRSGERVEDAAGGRRDPGQQESARSIECVQGQGRSTFLGDRGRQLADANREGLARQHAKRSEAGGAARRGGIELASIGASPPRFRNGRPFAPGPADPLWAEICRDAPSLEPAVCRVAHGMAGRIERLRHCGNGVVPLAAALAWVRLHGLLAGDAAGGTVCAADDRTARAAELAVRIAA